MPDARGELNDMTKAKLATDIPAAITMPDRAETRLGTLQFTDGFPDDATVEKVFDHLDFQRARAGLPDLDARRVASCHARSRFRGFGPTIRRCPSSSR